MYADHFSIDNIPFGIGSSSSHAARSVVTRLEDTVVFLDELVTAGLLRELPDEVTSTFSEHTVNAYAALSAAHHALTRSSLQSLLRNLSKLPPSALCPIAHTALHHPLFIPDFTDFSCSLHHVLNASEAVMGVRSAPPSFAYQPVGYTARTSSIVVSGTEVVRPKGQFKDAQGEVVFGATRKLDFELEVGAVVGRASTLGQSVDVAVADEYIFGLVLMNDWSARDIQGFEMPPLGPLNGKSFTTQISPWIITLAALAPFRITPPPRPSSPKLPPYLHDPAPSTYDLTLAVSIQPHAAPAPTTICTTAFSSLYWTLRDLVAHQTVNGCNLNVGDVLATGTISGEEAASRGCLLERAKDGGVTVKVGGGEGDGNGNGVKEVARVWIEDGDEVVLSAVAGKGVGFGECRGRVVKAHE